MNQIDIRDVTKIRAAPADIDPIRRFNWDVVQVAHNLFEGVLISAPTDARLTPRPSEWCRSLQNFSQCVLTVHPLAAAAALLISREAHWLTV